MAHFHDNALIGASGQGGYQIERSLRFNSADSAYLNRTFGTPTNNIKWTWSGWVKRSTLGSYQNLFCGDDGTSNNFLNFRISDNNDRIDCFQISGGSYNLQLITDARFRDPSAWYHVVLIYDSANATSTDRVQIYVNGNRQTVSYSVGPFAQNTACQANVNSRSHAIGRVLFTSGNYLDGYLTEIHFIDGQALTPSSFGETDTITGVWKPKKYSGSGYGTNGFYLNFKDNSSVAASTLGKDYSGNGNNWTPSATFSVTAGAGNDSLIDVPTSYSDGGNGRGNYCTLNPLDATLTLVNGNLNSTAPSNVERGARGTIGVSSGKWYYEYTLNSDSGTPFTLIGWASQSQNNNSIMPSGVSATGWTYYPFDLKTYSNGTASAVYGTTASASDTIMVALDLDNSKIYWGRQGTWFNSGDPASGTNAAYTNVSGTLFPWIQEYNKASTVNFGQRPFAYTPPSGFLALNTNSLPEPSIKKPSSYMGVSLWTGTGANQTISGLGFQPDLIWAKNRNLGNSHVLFDAVRGFNSNKPLYSDQTWSEGQFQYADIKSVNSDGYVVGAGASGDNYINYNTLTYVGWSWKESATPGFDIVTYTGTGVNGQSINHNLGVTPSLIIYKCRGTPSGGTPGNWLVWHKSISQAFPTSTTFSATGFTGATLLNSTSGAITYVYDNQIGESGNTYVAYLWSEVAGFSKFGSYTGNGVADGPFVFCNFRPRWVLIKSSTVATSWYLFDAARGTINVNSTVLYPNVSAIEDTNFGQGLDFTSNGFKVRAPTGYGLNNSGATYIFMAFAESPAKYALAR